MMTANGLFSKDGVREVSIDDICRKLCISKKTFYQYYAQKEDLVADVMAYNVERKKDEFERMVEGKNAVQVLKAMFALVGRKKTMDKDKRMVKDIMKTILRPSASAPRIAPRHFTTSLWIVSTPEGRRDSSVPTWTLRGCSC